MEKLLYFPGKYLVIHAITPSKAHSPIKVLYLLKNGLWIVVLNLSINFIIESLSVYGAKIEIFSGIRFTFGQFVGRGLFFITVKIYFHYDGKVFSP